MENMQYITTARSINLADGLFAKGSVSGPDAPEMDLPKLDLQNYQTHFDSSPILFWGKENLFPQLLDEAAQKVGILQQGLARLNQYCYNQGLFLYKVLEDNGDMQKIQIVHDKAIEDFFRATKIVQFLRSAINDYFRFGNFFPVYQLSSARKVVRLKTYDAPFCRIEKQNPVSGRSENLYVSAQWNYVALASPVIPDSLLPFITKLPLLDTWEAVDQLRYMDSQYNFTQHIKYITSGKEYGSHPWHATYINKWLNISASVPELKERLFMYAMTLNYVIYIDDDYWTTVYGGEFKSWGAEKKAAKVREVQESIENNLVGKDKSWKSLFANIKYTQDGKEKKSIIIEAIDNKLREGTFIPDNLHANGEILAALGVDACLLGATVLGDKISAGSGSNIREAALNLISLLRPDRDMILEPLRVIQECNGWDPDICFGFKDYIINTLDGRQANAGKETANP